jgi:hypothetical protein
MKSIKAAGAALLALSFTAGAAPAMPQIAVPDGNGLVTTVQMDCHPDVRRHFLPEYGRKVRHRHRQSSCRVVIVEEEEFVVRDCHRDVRRHYLPEYGRSVYHRHVGERCRVRIYRPRDEGYYGSGKTCLKIGPVTVCED